jgi:hypothetical protein
LESALAIFSTQLASRKETLAYNNDEYKTITSLTFKALPEYYGQPAAYNITQLNASIANGKAFSRAVGITYEQLVELLKTNFINPGFAIVPLFQKLKISLVDLQKFYVGTITNAQLDAIIPAGTLATDYGGDIKQWLRDNRQLPLPI